MRINQLGFNRLAPVLFSFMFLMSFSTLKAQTAATTPVDSQGNTLSASVSGVSELPEVTVKAKGIDQAQSFDEMHDSLNKVNILSQDQINQTPAKTVAQAAQQLPGVGVQHDTSEPRYITIRGTDPTLDIVTFNDTIIPSYDNSTRSVDLDDIPVGLVGEEEVFKTILPDMDGQGVGGQMNLVPKSAFDYPDSFHEIKAEAGIVPQKNEPTANGNLTWGETFDLGGPSKLGFLVAANYQYERFGIEDLEETYTPAGQGQLGSNSINEYDFQDYFYERDRGGIGANIDLRADRDNKYYTNFMYSGYDEYRRPKYTTAYQNIDAIPGQAVQNADGSYTVDVGAAGTDVEDKVSYELTQYRTLALGLGGENNINGFDLDYKASYAYADTNEPWHPDYSFKDKNSHLGGTITYNNTQNNGNSPTFDNSQLTGELDPANFALKGFSNETQVYNVNQYGLKADGKTDMDLGGGDKGTLKFGADANMSYAVYSDVNYSPTFLNSATMADFSPTSLPNFYPGNIYNMGPVPGINSLLNGLNINGSTAFAGPMTETDPVADQGNDWDSYENVYAGYGMYTLKTGNLSVMGGARIEATHIKYDWYRAYVDEYAAKPQTEYGAALPETGTIDYTNILPSLGFKYAFDPTMNARLNYSETLARPTYNQYIPSPTLGQNENGGFSSADPVVTNTYGNPNLKPMVSDNIDLSLELYPEKGVILAVDGFIKDITNYFATDYNESISSGGVTQVITYSNIPNSYIYGVEFQYQQQYSMLPDFLSGLGYRGSISFIGSQGETSPGVNTELPSQSDLIFNTGIFYKKYGFTIDVGGSFTGKQLSLVGDAALPGSLGGPVPNVYYDDYFQIDAKIQYAFTKDFTLYAEGDNLNNEPLRYFQGTSNLPIQNEYYGPTFDGGIDVTF